MFKLNHLADVWCDRGIWTGGECEDCNWHKEEEASKANQPDRQEGVPGAGGEVDEAAGEAGHAPDQHHAAWTDQAWGETGATEAGTRMKLGHCTLLYQQVSLEMEST